MVPFLFLFIGLLLLIPMVAFVPLTISFKGRWYIVGISFVLALLGTTGFLFLDTWQISLYVLLFCFLIAYLLEKRFSLLFTESVVEDEVATTSAEPVLFAEKETNSHAVQRVVQDSTPEPKDLEEQTTEMKELLQEEELALLMEEDEEVLQEAVLEHMESSEETSSEDWLEQLLEEDTEEQTKSIQLADEEVASTSLRLEEEDELASLLSDDDLDDEFALTLEESTSDDLSLFEEEDLEEFIQQHFSSDNSAAEKETEVQDDATINTVAEVPEQEEEALLLLEEDPLAAFEDTEESKEEPSLEAEPTTTEIVLAEEDEELLMLEEEVGTPEDDLLSLEEEEEHSTPEASTSLEDIEETDLQEASESEAVELSLVDNEEEDSAEEPFEDDVESLDDRKEEEVFMEPEVQKEPISDTTRDLLHSISNQLTSLRKAQNHEAFEELVDTMLRQELPDEMYVTFTFEKITYLLENKRFTDAISYISEVSGRYAEYPAVASQLNEMFVLANSNR